MAHELHRAVEQVRATVGSKVAVKDSFADTGLTPSGMQVLFGATWIARDAHVNAPVGTERSIDWSIIEEPGDLERWKLARDPEVVKIDPVFGPSLLDDVDIAFIAGRRAGEIVAGAIANTHAGALGLSNVFARSSEDASVWAGILATAAEWAPDLPVVGYESGAALTIAMRLGFRALGPLRVWISASK